jgi:hypothetical protein
LSELKERMDRFDDERLKMIKDLEVLLARHPRVLILPREAEKANVFARLRDQALELKKRLSLTYQSFLRDSYRRYLPSGTTFQMHDPVIREMRESLVNRFESVIEPDVKKALEMIGAFISRCQKSNI